MQKKKITINQILFFVILLAGGFLRFFKLSEYPGGVHVDEAFAGYEAYSMLNFGVDSWGYKNPIYFISWGSGMNVLESYLMMPFIKLLGLSELSIRLPQAILSVVAMVTFYFIIKKLADEKLALIGFFLMAVCPWHYMLSRWGLESNICISMILLGTLFFIYGTECFINKDVPAKNARYLILSGLFFGLDLYCYAATWIHIAVILSVWSIYVFIYNRKNKYSGKGYINAVIAAVLLVVMAIPLLLFILVNIGVIPEIRSFISIPQMIDFRGDEVFNFSVLFTRIHDLAYIIICQNDTQMWNAYLPYGMFYIFSLPVILIGVWRVIIKIVSDFKEKNFSYALMLFVYTALSCVLVLLQGVSIIRANYFEISLLFYWAIGTGFLFKILKAVPGKIIIVAYAVSFVLFLISYFGEFQERISIRQVEGSKEAIEAAEEMLSDNKYEKICLAGEIRHARVLFYKQYDVNEYIKSVKWKNYPAKYLETESFGPFVWEEYLEGDLRDDRIYIARYEEYDYFNEHGYKLTPYGHVWIAVKE